MTAAAQIGNRVGSLGLPLERVEDAALLRGEGRFIDDLGLKPGTLYAAFVRSPLPHAIVRSVDTTHAEAMPGVRTVLTGEDVRKWARPFTVGVKAPMEHWCLAVDRVRYVGEPVAIVCAEAPYLAEDAAARVDVDYTPLAPAVDPEAAIEPGASLLHEAVGSNLVSDREFRYGDPESAFAEAAHEVAIRIRYPRNSVTPIECFGVVAEHLPAEQAYEVTTHFQGPYALHPVMALALGVPGNKLRLRTPPDSGGSFGTKHAVFTYVVALALAARKARAPVKWIEDRLEHLSGATSATNRVIELRAAVTGDGSITALDYDQLEDCGAYLRAPEPATLYRMHGNLTGAYRIPNLRVRNRVVLTNKTPTGLVRGFGGPQVYFALERLVQRIALTLGLPHLEVIRRNLVPREAFPYRTPSGGLLDSGNFAAALDLTEETGRLAELQARQAEARAAGRRYGIGLAAIVEPSISNMGYITTVLTPTERDQAGPKGGAVATATVTVDPLGAVSVKVASCPQGQGHRTVLAQVVGDVLGLPPADVRVVTELDTGSDPWSVASGNYSSRFAGAVAGTAFLAAGQLRERLAALAAGQLDCDPKVLRFADGRIGVAGDRTRSLPFRRLAAASHWAQGTQPAGSEPVLSETAFWSPESLTPPNAADEINSSAAHGFVFDLCGVEVDPDTHRVRIDRYLTVHDAGRLLNPALADGQVRGGFSNALGAALYEHFAYGTDGSFLSGTFADYCVPTAAETPEIEIIHYESPSPFTPLGAKGIGEGNCMSTPVCIANAVADALGVSDVELPLTPSRVHALLAEPEPASPLPAADPGASGIPLRRDDYALSGAGTTTVAATPEAIWAVMLDPDQLRRAIPGCRRLDQLAPEQYRGEVAMGVGVVRGTFDIEVHLTDLVPNTSLRLQGGARGALGDSRGEATVRLAPDGDGTRIDYRFGFDLTGKVAAVGGRMIEAAAASLVGTLVRRLAAGAIAGTPGDRQSLFRRIMIWLGWGKR